MADTKISALTAATTPLAGTEVLPIVQSGVTKQVSVANLTAGRAVSAASLSLTTTPLGVASGGTGLATIGSTYIPYGNGTGALFANSNLTYDGATLNVTGIGNFTTAVKVASLVDSGGAYLRYSTANANSRSWRLVNDSTAYGDFAIQQSTTQTGSTYADIFASDSSGNLTFSKGNLVQGTAAKGINFTANSAAAGMTSQLLNWYEEGTWTPALKFGGNSTGMTYSVQTGAYTRIGRQITITCLIVLSAKGSSTGVATITGLPYSSGSGFQFVSQGSVSFDTVTYTGQLTVQIGSAKSYIDLQKITEAGVRGNLDNTDFSNSSEFEFTLTYFV